MNCLGASFFLGSTLSVAVLGGGGGEDGLFLNFFEPFYTHSECRERGRGGRLHISKNKNGEIVSLGPTLFRDSPILVTL